MAGKRKRTRPSHLDRGAPLGKRQRINSAPASKDPIVKQAVLAKYYPKVCTLRQYLISKLPPGSKVRRKKILSIGRRPQADSGEEQANLASFIDRTLIGVLQNADVSAAERLKQWSNFSQKGNTSISGFADCSSTGPFSQPEVVDFCIWLLFFKTPFGHKNNHLLCKGFRKDVGSFSVQRDEFPSAALPGIISTYPNSNVTSIKAVPWTKLLPLMGKDGEKTMIDLILDCGIFVPIESSQNSYFQLSGKPLGDLPLLRQETTPDEAALHSGVPTQAAVRPAPGLKTDHSPINITFLRNRILYARATLNSQREVTFGLRHIHALNRYRLNSTLHKANTENAKAGMSLRDRRQHSTIILLMYIFPRQFGLHNAFTSTVNYKDTAQRFQDYTLREEEIDAKFRSRASAPLSVKIPKRLRGKTSDLVERLQILHGRCPYKKLLEYYCPAYSRYENSPCVIDGEVNSTGSTKFETQMHIDNMQGFTSADSHPVQELTRTTPMMEHATPISMVVAFCRAVLSKLIPNAFWGNGEVKAQNERIFYRNVERFINMKRFETLSLHVIVQSMKISSLDWLQLPNVRQKMSKSDYHKRLEILNEFMYYIFDSVLIPLIRTNFHVTESNVHRYRLFFYRQDVWKKLTEPGLESLRLTMFEEVELKQARRILESRTLGFSQIRLLPKATGMRPIMNLRRRQMRRMKNETVLGSSINSLLAPVHDVLAFEKNSKPERLGSSLFSVGELYHKLKLFKDGLSDNQKPLYFAKLDVQAAFDTIPQAAVIRLVSNILSECDYYISKHLEIKPSDTFHQERHAPIASKPIRRWRSLAGALSDVPNFKESLESKLAVDKKNTVFISNVVDLFKHKGDLLHLLEEHVTCNMVKIGNKFYRQKKGIPQGSVLSSFLCNYFYADLEANHLSFLQDGNHLLLRLIDDFLLITTERSHAKRFLQVMHEGIAEYGVSVNPNKTLTNFEVVINNSKVPRLVDTSNFPYCGIFINQKSLELSKNRERKADIAITDSITVEFSKSPKRAFYKKALNTFKIQAHAMFFDTTLNSLRRVHSNIYSAFIETATKMWAYDKSMPARIQPGPKLVTQTIQDVIEMAFRLLKSKGKNGKNKGYRCGVNRAQVEWLALNAFRRVLARRQSRHRQTIAWLNERIAGMRARQYVMCERMEGVIRESIDTG